METPDWEKIWQEEDERYVEEFVRRYNEKRQNCSGHEWQPYEGPMKYTKFHREKCSKCGYVRTFRKFVSGEKKSWVRWTYDPKMTVARYKRLSK